MRPVLIHVTLLLTLAGCGPRAATVSPAERGAPAPQQTVVIFAAASLTEAFTEMGSAYEESHPGETLSFNFAGSQQLRNQILEGAAADVFAAADRPEMEALITGTYVLPESAQVFARNELVVALPTENRAGIRALADLARPGVKVVVADAAVPVGRYTLQFLTNMEGQQAGFGAAVLANVVSREQSVKAVAAKVQLGEADAGVVYRTDVAPDKMTALSIPAAMNVVAFYPIAVLKAAPAADAARAFVAFVLSDEGQAILARHGFAPRP